MLTTIVVNAMLLMTRKVVIMTNNIVIMRKEVSYALKKQAKRISS